MTPRIYIGTVESAATNQYNIGTVQSRNIGAGAANVLVGDADQDGVVTYADAQLIINMSLGSPAPVREGDVTNNGSVTATDSAYLQKYLNAYTGVELASPAWTIGTLRIVEEVGSGGGASFEVIATTAQHAASFLREGKRVEIRTFDTQPAVEAVELLSSAEGDAGLEVDLVGYDDYASPQTETVTLNAIDGRTVVTSTRTDWTAIMSVILPGAMEGTLTVREASGNATITTLAPGQLRADNRLFLGVISQLDRRFLIDGSADSTHVHYVVRCRPCGADIAARRTVARVWQSTTAGDIIGDLLDDALTAEGIVRTWNGADTIDSTLAAVSIPMLDGVYRSCADILDDLADYCNGVWWIDANDCLHVMPVQASGTAPYNVAQTAAVREILLSGELRSEYRNRQHIFFPCLMSSVAETILGNGGRTIQTRAPIYALTSVAVNAVTRKSTTLSETAAISVLPATAGTGLGAPGGAQLAIASTEVLDNARSLTIIGTTQGSSTDVVTETIALSGTTTVYSVKTDWGMILGVTASASYDADVLIAWGSGTVGWLYSGETSLGVITAGAGATGIWVKPYVYADAATTGWIGIKYVNAAGSTTYQRVQLSGTTVVYFGTLCKDVTTVYLGGAEAARTHVSAAPYEWQWRIASNTLTQSEYGSTLTSSDSIVVTYQGAYPARVQVDASDAGLETAADRIIAEGMTGIYEGVERISTAMTAAEANSRADMMLDRYARLPRTLSFVATAGGWMIGQTLSATLATLDIASDTKYVVQSVEFVQTLAKDGAHEWIWQVRATDAEAATDWVSRWRKILKRLQETEYINPSAIVDVTA